MSATSVEIDEAVLAIVRRAEERYQAHRDQVFRATDRLLGALMVGQWVFGIFLAVTLSPYAWEGKVKTVHMHVWTALLLGGVHRAACRSRSRCCARGGVVTRHVIAGGADAVVGAAHPPDRRAHRDPLPRVRLARRSSPSTATGGCWSTGHGRRGRRSPVRGMFWPESVYGIANPEWWRFLEHAFWVVFAVSFLVIACRRGLARDAALAEKGAELEALSEGEWRKSSVLDRAEAREDAAPTAIAS